MTGYVYMTASQKCGTIYIGVTNDLARRMPEHKTGQGSSFTSRYGVQRLVWYEEYFDITDAIQRETSLKRWPRQWKVELIEKTNPCFAELAGEPSEPSQRSGVTAWILGSARVASLLAPP
ncbi:MAG: GIY-YIG nuclease family protein [Mesorhizobium sp.]|nr:GIY-YIG nuclease family protein [Mesorhizobium sp.]RWB14757.1 MAG: GIY-YIG nuclease family protein [Mesorhizobium sp.]